MDFSGLRRTTNIEKVRLLFKEGKLDGLTNSDILKLTGINPHAQVFQITQKLEDEGLIRVERRGKEKVFYLSHSSGFSRSTSANTSSVVIQDTARKTEKDGTDGESGVKFLKDFGFVNAGRWKLGLNGLDFELTGIGSSRGVLYAFISGERVLYIGMTSRSLHERINNYRHPEASQRTNLKNKARIEKHLRSGVEVNILVFVPKDKINYKSADLNMVSGLEGPLISMLRPPWNLKI